MSELVLAVGSVAGVFTAIALERASSANVESRNHNEFAMNNEKLEVERRIVHRAMERLYDYERAGRITSIEREKLLIRYRQKLNIMDSKSVGLHGDAGDMNAVRTDLVAHVHRRIDQINSRLDDLASIMHNMNSNSRAESPAVVTERKEDKQVVQKKVEPVLVIESVDTAQATESDDSLDEIKKQIMQTLSRLEQAEVE